MKTLNFLALVTVTVMVVASCESEPVNPGTAERTPAGIEISGELSGNSSEFDNGDLFELSGDCYCNRGSGSAASFLGTLDLNPNTNTFELSDGSFELAVQDKVGNLDGEIGGTLGYIQDGNLHVTGYINVTCGTGCLKANGGFIYFLIEGPVGDGTTQPSAYSLEMSGYLN